MRIATWNVNSLNARLARVEEWIDYAQPDVLCMQETKLADAAVPDDGVLRARLRVGATRRRAVERRGHLQPGGPRRRGPGLRHRRTTSRVPPGGGHLWRRAGPQRLRAQRSLRRQRALRRQAGVAGELRAHPRRDLPIRPPGGRVRRLQRGPRRPRRVGPGRLRGGDPRHRARARRLRPSRSGGSSTPSGSVHEPGTFTWWDYRAGNFHKHRGLRIDLVLVSDDLVHRATGAFRDRDARKGQKPSDHAPVVVDFRDS